MVAGEAFVDISGAADTLRITCNEQTVEASHLLICSGSETVVPPIPGIDSADIWTSREALDNKEVPDSLLIIGGGVIGIEFAAFFSALGTKVVVVEMLDEILGGMDSELSALLRAELTRKGVVFYLKTKVASISGQQVEIENENGTQMLETSQILVSVGRRPAVAPCGLEMFRNGLKVNAFMQTSHPRVYACGDVTGVSLLAHTAVREAEIAVGHILGRTDAMSYRAIPAVVYTNPELAGVGRTEEALQAEGIPYTVRKLPMTYSGRFVAENEQGGGVCKILVGDEGAILGVHMLGNPASEIIVVAGMAIEKGMRIGELESLVFPHPTVGEILKEVASLMD
jgi:dihydrolipoamide dehydrogenase